MRYRSLYRAELQKVVTEAGKHGRQVYPSHGCDQHMPRTEVSFDHRVGSLDKGPCTADRPVPSFFFDGERMAPHCPVHRIVHGCRRFDAEIAFVPVDRLSRF